MKHAHHPRLAVVVGVLLAGCMTAPTRGQVGVNEVDSAVAPEARMTLADNETFQPPLPASDNALPIYPEAMLVHRLPPQAVCVRVSIDEAGAVSATAPIIAGPDCTSQENAAAAFYDAAQITAASWHFDPAFRCVYPKKMKPRDHGCWGDDVKEVPQAVSLIYRFLFEQVDGKGAVRVGS